MKHDCQMPLSRVIMGVMKTRPHCPAGLLTGRRRGKFARGFSGSRTFVLSSGFRVVRRIHVINTIFFLTLALVITSANGQGKTAVAIYDSTQIALDSYTVIKRLGVQDWRSAFSIRAYNDAAAATAALLSEAERLGADGLVNLHCLGHGDRPNGVGYYCYANAIKVKQ